MIESLKQAHGALINDASGDKPESIKKNAVLSPCQINFSAKHPE
jgi:hypothetical protein